MLGLDRDAFLWVVEHRFGPLDPVFVALSAAGYAGAIWIVLATALAGWSKKPMARIAALTAASVWTADLLALGIKALVDRPRPFTTLPAVDTLLGGTVGGSFPSGHAATSAAGAAIVAQLFRRAWPGLAVLALAVAYSRVYVGAHYPLDVAGGVALGGAVALAYGLLLRVRGRPSEAQPRSRGLRRRG